ncbi:unnamed protein product, partial [Meganyctiphanes norvegica]
MTNNTVDKIKSCLKVQSDSGQFYTSKKDICNYLNSPWGQIYLEFICAELLGQKLGFSKYPHLQAGPKYRLNSLYFDLKIMKFLIIDTTMWLLTSVCEHIINHTHMKSSHRYNNKGSPQRRSQEVTEGILMKHTRDTKKGGKRKRQGGPQLIGEGPKATNTDGDLHWSVGPVKDSKASDHWSNDPLKKVCRERPPKVRGASGFWLGINSLKGCQLSTKVLDWSYGPVQIPISDGEMKMYRRELEEDGLVVDPLKAVHQVRGVTAHEMVHHFWSPDVRFEWDTTIEQMTVLDRISEDTLVFLQLHKRVWPTAQRDALFWSHIREISNDHPANKGAHDTWIVTNHSTEHPDAPNDGKCVRVDLTVCFVCQTYIDPPPDPGQKITRANLLTKIVYCSVVNPGGWAPASVLRTVYKREYPKFLKRFTQYVSEKMEDQPVAFSGLKINNHMKHWRG